MPLLRRSTRCCGGRARKFLQIRWIRQDRLHSSQLVVPLSTHRLLRLTSPANTAHRCAAAVATSGQCAIAAFPFLPTWRLGRRKDIDGSSSSSPARRRREVLAGCRHTRMRTRDARTASVCDYRRNAARHRAGRGGAGRGLKALPPPMLRGAHVWARMRLPLFVLHRPLRRSRRLRHSSADTGQSRTARRTAFNTRPQHFSSIERH
jgi:hypothetical protein